MYVVLQSLQPAFIVGGDSIRNWKIAATAEEAQEALNFWPGAKVYPLGERLPMEPNGVTEEHHALCGYLRSAGKRACDCD